MHVRLTHPNRTSDVRQSHSLNMCDFRRVPPMDAGGIIEALKRLGVPHGRIAEAIGRDRTAATKMLAGTRGVKVGELEPLSALIAEYEGHRGELGDIPRNSRLADDIEAGRVGDYVPLEVLPTYGGMGGGGTGDGDRETALISRRLVEDDLRAKPSDLLVINVRGNSMEPLFHHGDQLIVDCRDKSPTQPGPFALLYDDGYVVKNVSWVEKRTKLRVASSNPEFGPEDFDPNEITIMGRPVWFARRL